MTIFWEIKPIALHGVGVHKMHISANHIVQSLCISVYIGPGGSDTLYQQAYWMRILNSSVRGQVSCSKMSFWTMPTVKSAVSKKLSNRLETADLTVSGI